MTRRYATWLSLMCFLLNPPVGYKGDKMRLFLTDEGYQKALENQERGFIKLKNHAKVHNGYLNYDHKDRDL